MARERPAVRGLLERSDDRAADRLTVIDAEFAAAFAAYQHTYGFRALCYDVAEPTLAESVALVLGLIRDQVLRGYDPAREAAAVQERRERAVAEARAALAARPAAERERFERALARAERGYPMREEQGFYTLSVPLALMRFAALELGRRLADRGLIGRHDDVFFLELKEARAALRQGSDQRTLVARRKGERAWVEAHPGPASYGKEPPPPPSLDGVPAEVQYAMGTMFWALELAFAQTQSGRRQAAGADLRGIAASPGRYAGQVRVIMDETEFHKIRAGDVLVCPTTAPVWSVLFSSVGALVTDAGGVLSHPAIIAREYCIPAVVATGNATSLLRDGQRVTVDGDAGTVELQP
jgi:rifampicin phosphotransferase